MQCRCGKGVQACFEHQGLSTKARLLQGSGVHRRTHPPAGRSFRVRDLAERIAQGDGKPIEEKAKSGPNLFKQHGYKIYTPSALFAEVEVDEDFGTVSFCRIVSAIAGGRIINHEAARSQVIGGIVWGIGMALQEQAETDHQFGRIMNHNFAEYHVPVNADVHDIEVIFVKEDDDIVTPIGVKALGEIGLVGVAAAIGNAIYNATGVRVRELPITLDKLIQVVRSGPAAQAAY